MWAFISILVLFFLGLLAVSDFVTKQIPATQALLDKIEPIKGWLGLAFMLYGLGTLIRTLLATGKLMAAGLTTTWIISIIIAGLSLGVGLLVGFEKLAALTGKGDQLESIRAKLAPHQRNMGFLSLIVVVVVLLRNFSN
jgi:uncharacterized membrane protein